MHTRTQSQSSEVSSRFKAMTDELEREKAAKQAALAEVEALKAQVECLRKKESSFEMRVLQLEEELQSEKAAGTEAKNKAAEAEQAQLKQQDELSKLRKDILAKESSEAALRIKVDELENNLQSTKEPEKLVTPPPKEKEAKGSERKEPRKEEKLKPSTSTTRKMLQDLNILIKQNQELNGIAQRQQNELNYAKQRENKIMFLLFTLQNKNYPVNEVFEKEVKHIPTARFAEFIEQKGGGAGEGELPLNPGDEHPKAGEDEEENKNLISFDSQASYESLPCGPKLLGKKPEIIPSLNLDMLPGYESYSSEEEGEQQVHTAQHVNPYNYQMSLDYIGDFYKKYEHVQPEEEQEHF